MRADQHQLQHIFTGQDPVLEACFAWTAVHTVGAGEGAPVGVGEGAPVGAGVGAPWGADAWMSAGQLHLPRYT
jgi:hypothetical protein